MGHYIGVDLHQKNTYVTRVNERGRVLEQVNLKSDPEILRSFFKKQPASSQVVVEASGHWYRFYELIEDKFPDLVLAHPLKTKAIAAAKIKTDKIDSGILAQLLRADLVPRSYVPTREVRDLREILRYRASLVKLRIQVKNRMTSVLTKAGLDTPTRDHFGIKSFRYLSKVAVRSCYRLELDGYIQVIGELGKEIEKSNQVIREMAEESPEARLLMTMPGVGAFSALLILSEIGDISRFPDAEHLSSYGGLVPCTWASGGKTHRGPITKQGSKWIRWILIENTIHAIRKTRRYGRLYARVRKKHGHNAGRTAVARAMLKSIFHMLRKKEAFQDSPASSEGV
jgi:transposase